MTFVETFDSRDTRLMPAPHPRASLPSGSEAAGVAFRNLSKRFGEKTVLSEIDLEIPAGQFVAIVGKSGCGKSTLLRLLVGLDQPSAGGVSIAHAAGSRMRLMFQEPRLLPWARVGANVAVGLPQEGGDPGRVSSILRDVGLEDRAGEWPYVLSGGQKQRVALARALVSEPRVLALDEPFGALDALTRIEMQQLLERLWLRQRFTAILVTHDVAEAVGLADRIVVLDEGRVALDLLIDLPRPRRRGAAELAAIEGRVLGRLFSR